MKIFRYSCVLCLLLLFTSIQSRASEQSFKGWELYSWRASDKTWRFSFLRGTNRTKSAAEITNPRITLHSVSALKQRLSKLAKGQYVTWIPYKNSGKKFNLPPRLIVRDVAAFARKRGLKFETLNKWRT